MYFRSKSSGRSTNFCIQRSAKEDQNSETSDLNAQTFSAKQIDGVRTATRFKNLSTHDLDPKLVAVLNKGPSYVNAVPKQLTKTCLLSRASLQATIDKLEEHLIPTNAINEFSGGLAPIIDKCEKNWHCNL